MSPEQSDDKSLGPPSRLSGLIRSAGRGRLILGSQLAGARESRPIRAVCQAAPSFVQPVPLEAACAGQEIQVPQPEGAGKLWLIRRALGGVSPQLSGVTARYASVVRGAGQRLDELEASAALCHLADGQPEDALFLDIETCGLAGCMVFLIGLMQYREGELHFEQYLARDYSEEPAILRAFAGRLSDARVLVSFNGKAFDMHLIRDRAVFHSVGLPRGRVHHLDLLVESRRRWRGSVPNCRLQTLETHLCRRSRQGDIPGWAIPDEYHRFVRTGDARRIADIVHHNLLDLLTMAQLSCLLLAGLDPAE
jgi:uncharacterized protein YprB with RNaseH-like and TPR domain